jgi:glycosyltransferase involved in cell wall biosynthesis
MTLPQRVRVARLPETTDVNPYQRTLYAHLRAHDVDLLDDARPTLAWLWRHRRSVDVLHFHWGLHRLHRHGPLAAPRLARLAILLAAARASGIRIAWTAHEPLMCAPGAPWLDRAAGRLVARAADVVMAHDHASAEVTRRHLRPRHPVCVLPLPSYAGLLPPPRPGAREQIRAELGLTGHEPLALAFGSMRSNKNLPLLARAIEHLENPAARILVVGDPRDSQALRALQHAAARDPRLIVKARHVSDQRAADLHAAADVSVVPRSVDWTASSAVLALCLGLPVVAADLPSVAELLGPGAWRFAPDDPVALARTLDAALRETPEARAARGARGREHVNRFDFPSLAAVTAQLFRGEAIGAPPVSLPERAPAPAPAPARP